MLKSGERGAKKNRFFTEGDQMAKRNRKRGGFRLNFDIEFSLCIYQIKKRLKMHLGLENGHY